MQFAQESPSVLGLHVQTLDTREIPMRPMRDRSPCSPLAPTRGPRFSMNRWTPSVNVEFWHCSTQMPRSCSSLRVNPFQSHQCRQLLGCCEDPEVVRQKNVERDRDVLGDGTSLRVRDHPCEVLEQVCGKRSFDNFSSGCVVDSLH